MSLKDDIAYIGSLRIYIISAVLIFAGATVMGFWAAKVDPSYTDLWVKELEALKWIMKMPPLMIMVIIFLKNLLACCISMLLGIGLGLVPLLVAVSNGVLLGMVSYQVLGSYGTAYLLAGLVPHGIIELPTVLISISVGFRLGHIFIKTILGDRTDMTSEIKHAIRILILWVAPLLFTAAMIETFITPLAISLASR